MEENNNDNHNFIPTKYTSLNAISIRSKTRRQWYDLAECKWISTSPEFQLSGKDLNRYPEPQPQRVVQAYANYAGVSTENVLVTRGGDEGIELIIHTFANPNKMPFYSVLRLTECMQWVLKRQVC